MFLDIEPRLRQYWKYKGKYKVYDEPQTLFYIVVYNDKVVSYGHKNVDDIVINNGYKNINDKVKNYEQYVLNLDEITLKYSRKDADSLKVICYVIKNDNYVEYQNLTRTWYYINTKHSADTGEFKILIKFLKNNTFFLPSLSALVITLYYSYFYFAFLDIGVPIDYIDENTLRSILFLIFVTVLSFYALFAFSIALIIPIGYLIYLYADSIPIIVSVLFIIVLLYLFIRKKYYGQFGKYFYNYIEKYTDYFFIKIFYYKLINYMNLSFGVLPVLIGIIVLIGLLYFPVGYFTIQKIFHGKTDAFTPTIFYTKYKSSFGLPKTVIINDEKFILFFKKNQKFYGYSFEKLTNFLRKNDKKNEQRELFCKFTDFTDKEYVLINLLKISDYKKDKDNIDEFSKDKKYKKFDINVSKMETYCNENVRKNKK